MLIPYNEGGNSMKQFSDYLGDQAYPVIEYRRKPRYTNGERTSVLDSGYTILHNYEKIVITVEDNGTITTPEQIKEAADAGTPIEMSFKDLEITIRPKTQWEIQASGRASQVAIAKSK